MDFAIPFIIYRGFVRVGLFFKHWYINGSYQFISFFHQVISGMEQMFAVRSMILFITQPIYGDYTVIGHIVGPIFRLIRIMVGISMYILFTLAWGAVFIMWLAIPLVLIISMFYGIIR
ncbi:MAG: hypothetical protein RIQ54_180 [Candidatus Parcubacteria bacterium]|jgi:hypothetical protein